MNYGVLAAHSTPIFANGHAVGSLPLCFHKARLPSNWELQLAQYGANVAGIAIERDLATQETKRAHDYAESILRTSPVPLLVLGKDLRVEVGNEAFYKTFQVEPFETEGQLIYELGNGQWNIPRLRDLFERILPKRTVLKHFEVTHEFETIGRRTMPLNARRLENETGGPGRVVLVIEDITEQKRAESIG